MFSPVGLNIQKYSEENKFKARKKNGSLQINLMTLHPHCSKVDVY